MVKNIANISPKHTASIYLLSFVAVILWGLSYIWSNRLLELGIPVEFFVFARVLLAGLLLLLLNLLMGKNIRIHNKDLPFFLLLSLFEPFIYFICETYGISFTESPTYSALIIASTPIASVVAGMLIFKEKFNILNMIGILVCLCGIVMVTLCAESIGDMFMIGLLLLIIAVLAEVGHASCTKALTTREYEPQVIVMFQFLIGSLYLLPLFLTKGIRNFDPVTYMSWDVWKAILCLAVFCSSIAFSLWVGTIKNLGVAKSSIFLSMIPVVTAVAEWVMGGHVLRPLQWVGIFISCLGVVVTQITCERCKCGKSKN